MFRSIGKHFFVAVATTAAGCFSNWGVQSANAAYRITVTNRHPHNVYVALAYSHAWPVGTFGGGSTSKISGFKRVAPGATVTVVSDSSDKYLVDVVSLCLVFEGGKQWPPSSQADFSVTAGQLTLTKNARYGDFYTASIPGHRHRYVDGSIVNYLKSGKECRFKNGGKPNRNAWNITVRP